LEDSKRFTYNLNLYLKKVLSKTFLFYVKNAKLFPLIPLNVINVRHCTAKHVFSTETGSD